MAQIDIDRTEELSETDLDDEGGFEFDIIGDNGLVFDDEHYLPEELLVQIFCKLDSQTLLRCQLVCKRWKLIIQSYVWRKLAENIIGRPLLLVRNTPWQLYYACVQTPFEKNLLKNHSGKNGLRENWTILHNSGDRWRVECPPCGVPSLPKYDPVFEGEDHCFVTSYHQCTKQQVVDLVNEGLIPFVLDKVQPPIKVSEWYSSRWDCAACYECSIALLNSRGEVVDKFEFHDEMRNERQNTWHHVEHEFSNYGTGVRKVSFRHSGKDLRFWAGHYGSKMAGGCVRVELPKKHVDEN